MRKRVYEAESLIAVPAQELFDWHKREDAFEKLVPPGAPVTVADRNGNIKNGDTMTLEIGVGPFTIEWLARHQNYEDGRQFEDVQVHGPFAYWVHTHEVIPVDDRTSRLRDHVEYALPFGIVGDLLGGWFVRWRLRKMFDYRHRVTKEELE